MKTKAEDIPIEILIADYKSLSSVYRVADKHTTSATAVKRILKNAGVLRTRSQAAAERTHSNLSYKRTEKHIKRMSEFASTRTGASNPFYGKKHKLEAKKKMSEHAKSRTKKRNPNYKTGKYLRRPRDYKIHELKKVRNFVFNRDNYKCFYCKERGMHLHAHHIIPYWVCKDAFLDNCNLITVCTDCHFTKAHLSNWHKFDTSLVTDYLIKKYSLDHERLNEMTPT